MPARSLAPLYTVHLLDVSWAGVTRWKGAPSPPCPPLPLPLASATDHDLNPALSALATHASRQGALANVRAGPALGDSERLF